MDQGGVAVPRKGQGGVVWGHRVEGVTTWGVPATTPHTENTGPTSSVKSGCIPSTSSSSKHVLMSEGKARDAGIGVSWFPSIDSLPHTSSRSQTELLALVLIVVLSHGAVLSVRVVLSLPSVPGWEAV